LHLPARNVASAKGQKDGKDGGTWTLLPIFLDAVAALPCRTKKTKAPAPDKRKEKPEHLRWKGKPEYLRRKGKPEHLRRTKERKSRSTLSVLRLLKVVACGG
jgi:hypothetical protein